MDDMIKREDVLQALIECDAVKGYAYRQMEEAIRAIPSVNIPHSDDWENYSDKLWHTAYERGKADRPQGEWIVHEARTVVGGLGIDFFPTEYECSVCGLKEQLYFINSKLHNFCPNCGARMKGADDGTR